jgi:hypothetical protein
MEDIILSAMQRAARKKKSMDVVIRYLRMKFRVFVTQKEIATRIIKQDV